MARETEQVRSFFLESLSAHDSGPRAHGWGSEDSQNVRFQVLTEVGDLRGKSLLDVGCGQGYLLDYLKHRGVGTYYCGLDLLPEMVERARTRHPEARFEVGDILNGWDEPFDYVLCSGLNNVDTGRNLETFTRLISRLWEIVRIAGAVNALSAYAPVKDPRSYYAQPEEAFREARKLSPRVVLRHDYRPNDFSLYLYR